MAVIEITLDNFESEVLNSDVPVLVDFWASWCGPCKMLSPIVEEIADEADGFKVASVNVDDQMGIASRYQIASIPTLLVFKGGEVVEKSVGVVPKDNILNMVKSV